MAMQTKLALLQWMKYIQIQRFNLGQNEMNFKFQLSWCFSPVAVIPGITSSYCLELERGTMGHKPGGKVSFICQVIVQLPRIFCSTWRQRLSSGRANRAELSSDQQWRFGILLNRWVLSMFFYVFLWFSMVFLGSFWICLCFGIVLLNWIGILILPTVMGTSTICVISICRLTVKKDTKKSFVGSIFACVYMP